MSVARVASLALVVSDLDASEAFFAAALGFERLGRDDGDPARSSLLGIPDVKLTRSLMRCGDQTVALLACDPPGNPYPAGSTSTDLWFQHFAIIVSDMDEAYGRLSADGRFMAISHDGPVQLPENSGGVRAFKFRDLDGHPLEFLEFPAGGCPEPWAGKREGALILGIDHSAISVGDTRRSVRFFEKCFGLERGPQTENRGPAQARMDDVADARVTVTAMMPRSAPPHVELLGYEVGLRRPVDGATRSNDIAATHFILETDALDALVEVLTAAQVPFLSPGVVGLADGRRAIAVLDLDGHRFVVEEPASPHG